MPFEAARINVAEQVLKKHGGQLCFVVIIGGPGDPTLDVATSNPFLLSKLPLVLRATADRIERENAARPQG